MSFYTGSTQPDYEDDKSTLLKKWCRSLWLQSPVEVADHTGPTQPDNEDNVETLLRKIAQLYYNKSH